MLMDVGAEYGHYTADVTRTFPVNGKFNAAQAEIYNVVLAAQEASFKAIRIGSSLPEVHNASVEVIKDSLLRLGLITDKNSDQYRMWFMHGTSHWLGMNVHDVGTRAKVRARNGVHHRARHLYPDGETRRSLVGGSSSSRPTSRTSSARSTTTL